MIRHRPGALTSGPTPSPVPIISDHRQRKKSKSLPAKTTMLKLDILLYHVEVSMLGAQKHFSGRPVLTPRTPLPAADADIGQYLCLRAGRARPERMMPTRVPYEKVLKEKVVKACEAPAEWQCDMHKHHGPLMGWRRTWQTITQRNMVHQFARACQVINGYRISEGFL